MRAVDRISAKEKHINKEFDHLGNEFREKQKRLDALQEACDPLICSTHTPQHTHLSEQRRSRGGRMRGSGVDIILHVCVPFCRRVTK
jgi:hypothetical protein